MDDLNTNIDAIYDIFKYSVIKMHLKNNLSFIDLLINNSIDRKFMNLNKDTKASSAGQGKKANNPVPWSFDYYIIKSESKNFIFYSFSRSSIY